MIMLKTILISALISVLTSLLNTTPAPASVDTKPLERYVVAATVESCRYNEVFVIDDNGDEWSFYGDDLASGQRVLLILNDNGTPDDVCDDIIEDALFCTDEECKED